jgi:hypothetical protein
MLGRPPRPDECESLGRFYEAQREHYRDNAADAAKFTAIGFHPPPPGVDRTELAAWTSVARVLMNLNEAIVRY